MRLDPNNPQDEPYGILTREEAGRLVTEALYTDLDEPEPFVKLLLVLFDNTSEPRLSEAIHLLITAAYDSSIVHSMDLDEYLDCLRQGQNPLKEARARRSESAHE